MRLGGVALVGAAVLFAGAAGVLWWRIRPVGGSGGARTVIVRPGESARQIGARLTEAGLLRDPESLVLAARLRGVADRLRQGEYEFTPSQSALDIVDTLARGEGILHRVTIPEGFTVRQIAAAFAAAGLVDHDRFLDLALHRGRLLPILALAELPIDSLEGYLFPDTYALPRGLTEEEVLAGLLARFEAAVGPDVRAAARSRGLTLHQLLTVASMIEREARVPAERPTIASVVYNRLRRGMRLEIDATVLYALGTHKEVITAADLAVSSPYNTYRHVGLPPGPIANPGLASITAAAAPADTPYLYYVLRPNGSHHFSVTLQEHQEAVRRYRP